jgi:hypothetical protein
MIDDIIYDPTDGSEFLKAAGDHEDWAEKVLNFVFVL